MVTPAKGLAWPSTAGARSATAATAVARAVCLRNARLFICSSLVSLAAGSDTAPPPPTQSRSVPIYLSHRGRGQGEGPKITAAEHLPVQSLYRSRHIDGFERQRSASMAVRRSARGQLAGGRE